MAIFLLGAATAYTVSVVPDIGTEAARDAGLMQTRNGHSLIQFLKIKIVCPKIT